jgi:hypothetical protein
MIDDERRSNEYSKHLRPRKEPLEYVHLPKPDLDRGQYLCEGCGHLIANYDVFRYFGALIHEVVCNGVAEVCGEVSDQNTTTHHTCGDHPPHQNHMDCKCCPKCHPQSNEEQPGQVDWT